MKKFFSWGAAFALVLCCLLMTACDSVQKDLEKETEAATTLTIEPVENKPSTETSSANTYDQPTASSPHSEGQITVEGNRFGKLLSYIPSSVVDIHPPGPFGLPIRLLDLNQIRIDLGIDDVAGSSVYQEKLDLVIALGKSAQGLSIYPSGVFPIDSYSYNEWGWDFADVDSVLHISGDGLSIMTGDFSRPEVLQSLGERGEKLGDAGQFSLFRINDGNDIVAVKNDVLIVSVNPYSFGQEDSVDVREDFVRMMIDTNLESSGMDKDPLANILLAELGESWGALIVTSPDVVEWQNELGGPFDFGGNELPETVVENIKEHYDLDASLAPLPWDLMAIGFRDSEDSDDLILVYHYPVGNISEEEVDLVRSLLSEIISLDWRGTAPEDLLQLHDILTKDSIMIIRGTTGYKNLLGNALERRDYSVQGSLSLIREEK